LDFDDVVFATSAPRAWRHGEIRIIVTAALPLRAQQTTHKDVILRRVVSAAFVLDNAVNLGP
jgi:hypothetical protein